MSSSSNCRCNKLISATEPSERTTRPHFGNILPILEIPTGPLSSFQGSTLQHPGYHANTFADAASGKARAEMGQHDDWTEASSTPWAQTLTAFDLNAPSLSLDSLEYGEQSGARRQRSLEAVTPSLARAICHIHGPASQVRDTLPTNVEFPFNSAFGRMSSAIDQPLFKATGCQELSNFNLQASTDASRFLSGSLPDPFIPPLIENDSKSPFSIDTNLSPATALYY
ncbi:hypothetical protein HC256_002177 [Beauveria bassiana]|nr:hypothetical protein HC256_002177 [Beauveria bassiana]